MVVLHGDVLAAPGLRSLHFILGQLFHIPDAGGIVVAGIGILFPVDAAGHVGDLLGSAVDAIFGDADRRILDGDFIGIYAILVNLCLTGTDTTIITKIHIFVQFYLDGAMVNGSLDIACFFHRPINFVGGIALDLDGLAQVLFYNLVITFFIRGQRKTAALCLIRDGPGNIAELAFRGGAVFHHIVFVPGLVVQAGDVVASLRLICSAAIRLFAGDGLVADGNFGIRIRTFAHCDFGEVRRIGHDDFQPIALFIAANAQVPAGCLFQCIPIGDAACKGQGGIELFSDFLPVIAHELQAIIQGSHGLGGAAILIGIDNACHIGPGKGFLTGLTVFSCLSFFRPDDGGAVSLLAVGPRKTILAGQTKGAFLAVSSIFPQIQFVIELDVVGQHAIAVSPGRNHQVAILGIIFPVGIGSRISCCRIRFVIDRDHRTLAGDRSGIVDSFADFGQLVFRSSPAADIIWIRYTPVLIGQTDRIVAINRMVALVGGQFRIGEVTNLGISRLQGTIIQIDMFGQLDVELAIIIFCHTDIGIRQITFGFPYDIQPFIEFPCDDF